MRLLPGTKKFGFRTIVLTQAQPRSRLFVCLFRIPSFSAPAPPNRLRYPGARLFRPVRFSGSLPALRPRSAASACFPACESCLPPAPPPSLAPAPPNRFRYPGARLLRPEQDGRERLRPSGRSAAASGGPAGRPTPAGRGTAIPPRRSQTGRFPSTAAPASRRTTPGSGTDVAYRCV